MYVCICQAVTEQDIKTTVAQGTITVRQLCQQLGCASQCGQCAKEVQVVHQSALMDLYAAEV